MPRNFVCVTDIAEQHRLGPSSEWLFPRLGDLEVDLDLASSGHGQPVADCSCHNATYRTNDVLRGTTARKDSDTLALGWQATNSVAMLSRLRVRLTNKFTGRPRSMQLTCIQPCLCAVKCKETRLCQTKLVREDSVRVSMSSSRRFRATDLFEFNNV